MVVDDLRHLWREPEGRRACEAAGGLCRVHAGLALNQLREPGKTWLRGAAAARLRRSLPAGGGDRAALLWSAPPLPRADEVYPKAGREWSTPFARRLQPGTRGEGT